MIWAFFIDVIQQFLRVTALSAPYLLLGLLAAGILRVFVPDELLMRVLGGTRKRSVVLGALLGVPLPICSCGIVPLSMAMRRKGAGRGATMSFLISTPETSADSVALTFGLMGPVMAIARPVVALVTAVIAGLAVDVSDHESGRSGPEPEPEPEPGPEPAACDGEEGCSCSAADPPPPPANSAGRTREAFRYAYAELLPEIGTWLLLGLVLTALVGASVPDAFLEGRLWGTGLPSMLMAVLIGLPLYMCASASTPLAAALVVKGLNPGAALVFLLTGPVTNVASIALVRRFHGARFTRIYLATTVGVALAAGIGLNVLLAATAWAVVPRLGGGTESGPGAVEILSAVVLAALLIWNYSRTGIRKPLAELVQSSLALGPLAGGIRRNGRRAVGIGLVLVTLGWLLSGMTVVQPGEVAVVRRFGRLLDADLTPGAHLRLPYPIERVDRCAVDHLRFITLGFRLQGLARIREGADAQELDMLTGDENLVDATAVLEYRVVDPRKFLYAADDVDAVVRNTALTAITGTMIEQTIDDVLTNQREPIQQLAISRAQRNLDEYGVGVRLVSLRLMDVHAPPAVHDAFREVASAQENHATSINRAEGHQARLLAQARGERARLLGEAEAQATDKAAVATGDAAGFQAFATAIGEDRGATRAGSQRRLYLEAVERVLAGRRKVIRPGASGGSFELWFVPAGQEPGSETGDPRIQVPVLPQSPGDPDTMEITLEELTGLPSAR